jgi:hypothetical protein
MQFYGVDRKTAEQIDGRSTATGRTTRRKPEEVGKQIGVAFQVDSSEVRVHSDGSRTERSPTSTCSTRPVTRAHPFPAAGQQPRLPAWCCNPKRPRCCRRDTLTHVPHERRVRRDVPTSLLAAEVVGEDVALLLRIEA